MRQGPPSQIASPPPPPPLDAVSMQLQALTAQEIESVNTLVRLEGDRVSTAQQLRSASGDQRVEVTRQLSLIDGMINGEKAKIANIKDRIAALTGESPVAAPAGSLLVPPEARMFGFTKDEVVVGFLFSVTMPLLLVALRIMWIRSSRHARPVEEGDRLARLEQAVEAVAIEVERIGESQRFQTKLMTERESSSVARE